MCSLPVDGTFVPETNSFTDAGGVNLVNIHPKKLCEGENCVIHNQSDHVMRALPLHVRIPGPWDIKPQHFERICEHGIGHPDPDDMRYWKAVGQESIGVHGCDGCCHDFHVLVITRIPADEVYDEEVEFEVVHPINCPTETWKEEIGPDELGSFTHHTCGEQYEIDNVGLDFVEWDFDVPGFPVNEGNMHDWQKLPAGKYVLKAWHTGPDYYGEYDGGLTLDRVLYLDQELSSAQTP